MDETKQPGIRFENIFIVEENFWRAPNVPIDSVQEIKMNSTISSSKEKANILLETNFNLKYNDENVVTILVKHIAKFSIDNETKNMLLDDFVSNHGVALMFPYIREHITSLSIKAGIKPIIIPPINIKALLNNN